MDNTFALDPTLQVYKLTFQLTPETMLFIVAFRDLASKAFLLNEGQLEVDQLDGSMFDGDGVDRHLAVKLDHATNRVCFETLPEDYRFWQGTENGQHQGMLGFYSQLLNEAIQDNLRGCDYNIYPLVPELVSKENYFEEALLLDRDYVVAHHADLLAGGESANSPAESTISPQGPTTP